MPINKETIISVFTEKLTLEQWLKTINKALDEAVLTGVEIAKKGNATLSFKFTFEDGTYLETNDLVLQQGESVNGAYIQNGHLYLTLTNGTNLDAGNVKPVSNFSIDENQHLIVNYGDGTSQDLGAIFNGNITISGNLAVTGDATANSFDAPLVTGNLLLEKMEGYGFEDVAVTGLTKTWNYAGIVKTGNKLTIALFLSIDKTSLFEGGDRQVIAMLDIPTAIGNKLYPYNVGGNMVLDIKKALAVSAIDSNVDLLYYLTKPDSHTLALAIDTSTLQEDTTYTARFEVTFLLSDNLAQ